MVSIGPTIGIKGESSYRSALRNIISETKVLNSEMDLMVAKFKSYDSTIEKNTKKQEMLNRQLDASRQALAGYQDQQERAKTRVDELRHKQEEAIKAYEKATSAQVKNTKEVQEAEIQMNKTSDAVQNAERVYNEWSDKVNKAELEVVKLENALKELSGATLTKVGEDLEKTGSALTKYITTPMIAAGTASIKWASDFTDGMAKIYTIADESKKPMAEMRQELIELSNQSGYSLEDLAEAEYQAVSASVDTAKAVDFLSDATKLARGGFTTATQAVDLLTTVINAYGMEAEDASYISDVLLRTQNDGKTIIDELAMSMGTVIPTAANYNVSLEQLAAAYATMTKQGVNTSRATTFLNAMFTELEKESSAISKTLDQKTGKSFAQLMGEGKSLAEVLKILYESVDGDNEQFQRLFGNIRSDKAAASLLTGDFAILNYEVERMANATGQTKHALEVLETPSLKAKRALEQLKNSGMELGTQLMNRLMPTFVKVTDAIRDFTEYVAKFNDRSWSMVTTFGAIATATGPVLTGIGKLTQAVGAFMSGTLTFSGAVPIITGVVLAIGALITASEVAAEQHREEIRAVWGLEDEYKNVIETSHALNEEYHASKQAIEEKKEASLAEIGYAESLIERYNGLVDSEGHVRQGYEKIAEIVLGQLAEALGMNLEQVQGLIEENGRFGASIEQTIESMRKRAEAAAAEEYLTEAYRRMYDAQAELNEINSALVETQSDVTEASWILKQAEDERNYAIEHGIDVTEQQAQALVDAQTAYDTAVAAEQELQTQKEETIAVVEEAKRDIENASQALVTNTERTMDGIANGIISGGRRATREADNVKSQVKEGLTIDGTWQTGYNASAGLADGIYAGASLVSGAASYVSGLVDAISQARLKIGSPSRVMRQIGRWSSEGLALGMEDEIGQIKQASAMMANSAINGFDMNSYSPGNNYTKTISAPISINLTVNGNVDNEQGFARSLAEDLVNLINRDREVFA